MALKTIEYTVTSEGITPKTEQSGGIQGEHNITEVLLALGSDLPSGTHYRVQVVDGAGGFYSSELLTPNEDGKISFLLCEDITKPGGVAYLHLVVTEAAYDDNGKYVSENRTFLSKPMRLRFENSGVGSPSDNAYRLGITGALLKANDLAAEASKSASVAEYQKKLAKAEAESSRSSANESENHENNANTYATNAQTFANDAKTNKEFAEGAANDAQNSANTARANAQTALEAVEEVTKIKGQVVELKQGVDAAAERASVSEVSASQAAGFAMGSADFANKQARIATNEVAWVRENIGDMSEALKAIIELQETYIGGND